MPLARALLLLVALLLVPAALAQSVTDPRTGEPVPLGLTAPSDLDDFTPARGGDGPAFLAKHLPAGTTKLIRALPEGFVTYMDGAQLIVGEIGIPVDAAADGGEAIISEVARIDLPALPTDAVVSGELLYVALGKAPGLVVYDLSGLYDDTPEFEVVEAGRADLPSAFAVLVDGPNLYVGRGTAGVSVYDAFPGSLAHLASFDTPGSANGLGLYVEDFATRTILVVADGNVGSGDDVRLYDVTDKTAPTLLGSVEANGFATYAAVGYTGSVGVAYVTGGAGLIAIDLAVPEAPAVLDVIDMGGTTYEVVLDEAADRAYVNGLGGARVVDISDPADLVEVAAYDFGGQGLTIAVDPSTGVVLAGDRFGGVRILEPSTLTEIGRVENGGFSHKPFVDEATGRLFVTDLAGRLRTLRLDIGGASDVAEEDIEARLDVPSNTQEVIVRGDVAYVTHSAGLTVLDVSEVPYLQLADVPLGQSFGMALEDDVLWVAAGFAGFVGLDVSNPSAPETLSVTAIGSNVVDVVRNPPFGTADVLYVASFGGGLLSYDVTAPESPAPLDAEPAFGFLNALAPFREAADPAVLYVADGQAGLRSVSVADPSNLTSLSTVPTSTQARDVDVTGAELESGLEAVVVVADDFYGLRTFAQPSGGGTPVLRDAFPTADRGIGVTGYPRDFVVEGGDFPNGIALMAGEAGVYIYFVAEPVASEVAAGAAALRLAAFPNPTRGTATVAFDLVEAADVEASVYDLLGRRVATLATGARAAGPHEVAVETAGWAPGVYVVRVRAGEASATARLTVVR